MALAADRFRVGLRNVAAVIRLHPAGSLLPTALAGLLLALFVVASVSARMVQLPQAQSGGPQSAVAGSPAVLGPPVLVRASRAVGHASGSGAQSAGHAGAQVKLSLVASTSRPRLLHPAKKIVQACLQSRDHVTSQIPGGVAGTVVVGHASPGCKPVKAPTPVATVSAPHGRPTGKTGDADWGDAQTLSTSFADWGDGPSGS